MLRSTNPATGKIIETFEEMTRERADSVIAAAQDAFLSWRRVPFSVRAEKMRAAAQLLRQDKEIHAQLMAREMGKPVKDGRAESEKCAWVCDHYADAASDMLAPEPADTGDDRSYVAFSPLGVILAIMPWNYPFWQVFRFAAPALMAGNAAVLKHAGNVTGCALTIEKIFKRAGFPEGLFGVLTVAGQHMEPVIENRNVRAVTLTGSGPAGRAVAGTAGRLLKKTVLELGGSDPYIILADADIDHAAETCAASRLLNSGQSCIAAKRFIVEAAVRKAFEERLVEKLRNRKMGDPLDDTVDIGPQARVDLRDDLHRQVTESIEKGATRLTGGSIPEGDGAYYPVTVLTDVAPGMPAFDEETFGPVAAVVPVPDEAAAVRAANATPYGLGAAVFTRDVEKGERIAVEELEAGSCFVNGFVKSDPRLPFGGIKESGYGRELSHFGIREFVNVKTVVVVD